MDIQKVKKKYLICILVLIIASFILYWQPLFSGKPLGLDALGHLSKVSYIKQYGFVSWDMSWYSGAPFLKFYSPLFYYLNALFSNSIFGANFLCFISILLTSMGIFLLVRHYSKNNLSSLVSALFFLSILCTSYYYIATANHPFVFSLFTLPFSLFFLEKSLENKKYYWVFSLFLVLAVLSHIFIAICLAILIFIRFFPNKNKKLKLLVIFSIPVMISFFWLIPFFSQASQFVGDSNGYIPSPKHLAGFGNYTIWGHAPGEMGITFIIFLLCLLFSFKFIKNEKIRFLLISSVVFLLLLEGILGKYYPNGLGALRFILPFSVVSCLFLGVVIAKIKSRTAWILIILALVLSLFYNYQMINENYQNHSYNDNNSRYTFMTNFSQNPEFNSGFDNYRFGTSRYVFGETMNYFIPGKSQTFGYHDQGLLFPETTYLMFEKIWKSDDLNSSLFFLDWFGINKFELAREDTIARNKFENNSLIRPILSTQIANYPFTLYSYEESNPIISLVKVSLESSEKIDLDFIKKLAKDNVNSRKLIAIESDEKIDVKNNFSLLNYSWKRDSSDRVEVRFNDSNGGVVVFREYFHDSWKAKEYPSGKNLRIYKAGTNFMLVIPDEDAKGVVFYQSKTANDYLAIFLSLLGIFLVFLIVRQNWMYSPE